MLLAKPHMIPEIDKYAAEVLGIPTRILMQRAAKAVADAVASSLKKGAKVTVFAGKGNNGGDGYAAALLLMDDFEVCVYDVFGAGQKSDAGRYFFDAFTSRGGDVSSLTFDSDTLGKISKSDCVIDAVFGTGFVGEYPREAIMLADILRSLDTSYKLAIDVPLGVNASDGSVYNDALYHADATVALGFVKPGLVSYPAKEYVGKLIYDNIGLHNDDILHNFEWLDRLLDYDLASSLIPKRRDNSNKGSFGKLLMICGSSAFPGAAHLALEAALRSGVGLVTYLGEKDVCDSLLYKHPETIYKPFSVPCATDVDLAFLAELSSLHTGVLIGSGSSRSSGLKTVIERLLSIEGSPVILDADAINVVAENSEWGRELIRSSPRSVILTPHPLELSRISGIPTDEIQSDRLSVARRFAAECGCILVLKGAATVVTDGVRTYINSSGSSALAKAGSGDVLAGMLASVVASGTDPLSAAALSVYFHGLAADVLATDLSEFGVTPSDLPCEIGRQLAKAKK